MKRILSDGKKSSMMRIIGSLIFIMMISALPASAKKMNWEKELTRVSDQSLLEEDCGVVHEYYPTLFYNSEVEPWIVVNPTNSKNIVIGWQQDRWEWFCSNGHTGAVTYDGGKNWIPIVFPDLSICTGNDIWERTGDTWLSFAPNGDLYVSAVSFSPFIYSTSILVNKSTDGGLTWGDEATSLISDMPPEVNDKESITADPYDPNYVYAVWSRNNIMTGTGPTWLARRNESIIGNNKWEEAQMIYDPGPNGSAIANQILVLPNGDLVNLFHLFQDNIDKVAAIRSTDKGQTWSEEIIIAQRQIIWIYDPDAEEPQIPNDYITKGLIDGAVDPNNGHIYAVWEDGKCLEDCEGNPEYYNTIMMSMSADGGINWSEPIQVNKTPIDLPPGTPLGYRHALIPSVEVAKDGTVGVTYYDFRNNDADVDLKTDYFIVFCEPKPCKPCTNSNNWGNELRITDESFDIRQTVAGAGGLFLGDYVGLAVDDNDFLAAFSMPHDSDFASVFFARIKACHRH